MTLSHKIEFLNELVACFHTLLIKSYDSELKPVSVADADELMIRQYFLPEEQQQNLLNHCNKSERPLVQFTPAKMVWIGFPEKEDYCLTHIHIVGPFFFDPASAQQSEALLEQQELPPDEKSKMLRVFRTIPVVPFEHVMQFIITVHYTITGEKLNPTEVFRKEPPKMQKKSDDRLTLLNLQDYYETHLQLLTMVRDGNPDYQKIRDKLFQTSNVSNPIPNETLRQIKNRTIGQITLLTWTAIEAGLNPAMTLAQMFQYVQRMEECSNLADLGTLTSTIEQDFISQVYRRRSSSLSKVVLDCCDYVHLHLEEELTRTILAKALNYSEGYLSHRFKEEMGVTIKDYITQQRLEYAGQLLNTTEMSVQDISERLQFCSHSHFASAFKKIYGMTPKQWRDAPK